jgi:hypothetical protein
LKTPNKNTLNPSYSLGAHLHNKDEEEEIENMLEDFDIKHMNAFGHKIKRHIDIVTSIAQHNSDKEHKAFIIKQKEMKKGRAVLEKCYTKYEKINSARKKVNETLKHLQYDRKGKETIRNTRVNANKNENKIIEVSLVMLNSSVGSSSKIYT